MISIMDEDCLNFPHTNPMFDSNLREISTRMTISSMQHPISPNKVSLHEMGRDLRLGATYDLLRTCPYTIQDQPILVCLTRQIKAKICNLCLIDQSLTKKTNHGILKYKFANVGIQFHDCEPFFLDIATSV